MNTQHHILQEYFPKLGKLEEEYMAKAMQRQKDGITKPQIVAGREFKGTSFISKPDKIIFKVTVILSLMLVGLHRGAPSHPDHIDDKCFVLVQFFQTTASP